MQPVRKWIYLRKRGRIRNNPGKRAISREMKAMNREGGADGAEEEVPLPPEYEGAWTVAGILSEYEGVDLDTDYEEMVVGYIVGRVTVR